MAMEPNMESADIAMDAMAAPMMENASMAAAGETSKSKSESRAQGGRADSDGSAGQPDLDNVSARKNLNETAFFFPHLIAGPDGTVKLEFTMPEALTEWKFMGFSHDQELRGGLLTSSTVTAKDLMVQPNPPRFLREGDMVEFLSLIHI